MKKLGLHGFSLIEIMVATVLMGLMGGLLMMSLNTSINAKESVEEISGRYQMVRQAMARMSREISMAYLSKHIKLEEPAGITQFKGLPERLSFSAFGHVVRQKDAKQSDIQVLGFYLGKDKSGNMALMRRNHPNLNLDVEKGGVVQVLCPNVSKLTFSYFDVRQDKWAESWLSDPSLMVALDKKSGEGDKEKSGGNDNIRPWRLPNYVKISMTVDMGNGQETTWVSQAQIPIQEPLDLQH